MSKVGIDKAAFGRFCFAVKHELHDMKLWYKMTREFPEMTESFAKLNRIQHEEYVLAEFMKNPDQWKLADLQIDLNKINNLKRDAHPKSLPKVDFEYFKSWKFP